jgi:DNA-binding SARP family transcriptional activator
MYEARFLGGASLRLDGTPVGGSAAHRHPLALLAILAAHPVGEVSRDKLIAFLWPDRDSSRGRHLLSEALYVLRSTVGRKAIRNVGKGLILDPDLLWTDVRAFGDAVEAGDHCSAVEFYGGAFLDGFHLPQDDGEFQHWVDARRMHLAAQYDGSMIALADMASAAGDELEAAHWLRLRLAHDPFSGACASRLMTVLVDAGDRAEAIRVGREHENRLRDELGLPPSEAVTRLRASLEGPRWIPTTRRTPVDPSPQPRRFRWSIRPRRGPRTASSPEGLPHAPFDEEPVASPRSGAGGWLWVLGAWTGPLLLVAAAALLVGLRVSVGAFRLFNDADRTFPVAVLPFSSCCDSLLTSEAERSALLLADTLARVPGHVPLDPDTVLATWRRAGTVSGKGPPETERVAVGLGAERYVTGSFLQVTPSEVQVELTLRQVGRREAVYVRGGSAPREEVASLIQSLAGSLAEYLRGEAAGRGVTGPGDPRVAMPSAPAAISELGQGPAS